MQASLGDIFKSKFEKMFDFEFLKPRGLRNFLSTSDRDRKVGVNDAFSSRGNDLNPILVWISDLLNPLFLCLCASVRVSPLKTKGVFSSFAKINIFVLFSFKNPKTTLRVIFFSFTG
jgi:hypothetical protein